MPIEINPLESDRFGIVAARLTDPFAPLNIVDAAADAANVDMITARVDANDFPHIHALEENGFRLMDTLVYYHRSLDEVFCVPKAVSDVSMRLATTNDNAAVSSIAQAAFKDYIGHYHIDPRLDKLSADAAYVQWAENSIASMSVQEPVLVACNETGAVGFLVLSSNSPNQFEITLNAVHPDVQRTGVYAALVAEALALACKAAAKRVIASTQINNYGVQRVWSRMGFRHVHSLYTFHKWYSR